MIKNAHEIQFCSAQTVCIFHGKSFETCKWNCVTSTRVTFVLLIFDERNCFISLEMVTSLVEIQLVTDTAFTYISIRCYCPFYLPRYRSRKIKNAFHELNNSNNVRSGANSEIWSIVFYKNILYDTKAIIGKLIRWKNYKF